MPAPGPPEPELEAGPEPASWHVLTGEYPPEPGGIGDYSALVASALAATGRAVHVWTTAGDAPEAGPPGTPLTVHRDLADWSGRSLRSLGRALDACPAPRRLLVQYAPNVWGKRGLNLGFCRWLGTRRDAGDDVRPVFHELWYGFNPRDRPGRWVLSVVQRAMVRAALRASTLAYASIPTWVDWARPRRVGGGKRVVWLPVPSNVPAVRDPEAVAALKGRLSPDGRPVVGSFGTYHGPIADALRGALPRVGGTPRYLLMGRGSEAFAARLAASPGPTLNLTATGPLAPRTLSVHLQACDLLVQPYPDGLTSRRGSLMAALAHGRAVVSNTGWLSEPLWAESGAVALAPPGDPEALARLALGLLDDPAARDALAARGRALYEARFALERTVETLTGGDAPLTPFALVTGDFVRTGGMDRANHALASYLLRQGAPVHLVGFRADAGLTASPGATWHPVAKPWGRYPLGLPLLRRRGRSVAAAVAGQGGRVVVNGGNCPWPDINWVHYVHAAWAPPRAGPFARRLKTAVFRRVELRAERDALRRARVVVANSERTRAALLERFDLPPGRVKTVYYGTDPDEFRPASAAERAEGRARLGWPPDGRPALAFVGALGDARKGFDTLLGAWARLALEPSWDARLAVVGAGATLPGWRAEADRRGLSGSVEFLGFRADVPAVLRACDGLVSPTRYEAYGLNVHEALAAGLPALVSASAGVAERYPEALRDWLIPDPEDPLDLAERLRRWRLGLGRPSEALLAFSERLRAGTWDAMAASFLDAAGVVVAGGGAGRG